MPKPNQSWRKRFFYNQNLKRVKSGQKYKNLINHTITLIKRLEKEGMTKWLANALNRAQVKIKSYGITFNQVSQVLEHKELSKLNDLVATHLVFVQKKGHNVSISTKREVIGHISPIIGEGSASVKKAAAPKKAVAKKETAEKKTPVKKVAAPKKAVAKKETAEKKTPVKKVAAPKKAV